MARSPIGVLRRATTGALGVEYALPMEKPIPRAAAGGGYSEARRAGIGRRCVHWRRILRVGQSRCQGLLNSRPRPPCLVLVERVAECACGILIHSFKGRNPYGMWHLIEDFFEQGVVVKLFLAVGWLAVVIMIASLINLLLF